VSEWKEIAMSVAESKNPASLWKVFSEAARDKVDATTLIQMISVANASKPESACRRPAIVKDPATVTLEHLCLALEDIKQLSPAGGMTQEIADEICDVVSAIRTICRSWRGT
jgi:hypothetical protein